MWPNPLFPVDLVTLLKKSFTKKLYFCVVLPLWVFIQVAVYRRLLRWLKKFSKGLNEIFWHTKINCCVNRSTWQYITGNWLQHWKSNLSMFLFFNKVCLSCKIALLEIEVFLGQQFTVYTKALIRKSWKIPWLVSVLEMVNFQFQREDTFI